MRSFQLLVGLLIWIVSISSVSYGAPQSLSLYKVGEQYLVLIGNRDLGDEPQAAGPDGSTNYQNAFANFLQALKTRGLERQAISQFKRNSTTHPDVVSLENPSIRAGEKTLAFLNAGLEFSQSLDNLTRGAARMKISESATPSPNEAAENLENLQKQTGMAAFKMKILDQDGAIANGFPRTSFSQAFATLQDLQEKLGAFSSPASSGLPPELLALFGPGVMIAHSNPKSAMVDNYIQILSESIRFHRLTLAATVRPYPRYGFGNFLESRLEDLAETSNGNSLMATQSHPTTFPQSLTRGLVKKYGEVQDLVIEAELVLQILGALKNQNWVIATADHFYTNRIAVFLSNHGFQSTLHLDEAPSTRELNPDTFQQILEREFATATAVATASQ